MIKKLASIFKKIITIKSDNSYQKNLDRFIISKCPQSSAEVDFWIQHYERYKRDY